VRAAAPLPSGVRRRRRGAGIHRGCTPPADEAAPPVAGDGGDARRLGWPAADGDGVTGGSVGGAVTHPPPARL